MLMKMSEIKNKRKIIEYSLKCLSVAMFPFVMCLVFCKIRGFSFFDLYLPTSFNNDVLFYFKQVEGIVRYGCPRGYFGYNESHALYGSLATWNPILFLPWIIFCLIFGTGYESLIVCNIIVFSLSLVCFVLLTKTDWVGIVSMLLLLAVYPSFFIHIMNGLPETIIAANLIVFFGCALRIVKNEYCKGSVIAMFAIAVFLTLCRPFMLILFIAPCYFLIKNRGKKYIPLCAGIVVAGVAGYFVFSHFFASEFFAPMFNTDILKLFFTGKFSQAFTTLWPYIKEMLRFVKHAFSYGLTSGTQYYVAFYASLAILISMIVRKDKKYFPVYLTYILTVAGIVGATLVIGNKINEGGRHMYAFSIMGIILCATIEKKEKYIVNSILAAALIVFILRGAMIPTDYDVPKPNDEIKTAVEYLDKAYEEKGIKATVEISWDNTIIWPLNVNYNELYSVPQGMGINVCLEGYINSNFDDLQSRYIVVSPESDLEIKCIEHEYEEIARTDNIVLYKRY